MKQDNQAELVQFLSKAIADPITFSKTNSEITLRPYQMDPARAIIDSVLNQRGLSFVVMFPRQSGKNELQANLEAYLLTIFCQQEMDIVKVSPTWKPQSVNAMHRLERLLKNGLITQKLWEKESGYIYRIGRARISFFSGEPQAHIVGATASTLLEVDEAQDVQIAKYDKEIAPMAASTNANAYLGELPGRARHCWLANFVQPACCKTRMAYTGYSTSPVMKWQKSFHPTMPSCGNKSNGWVGITRSSAPNSSRRK